MGLKVWIRAVGSCFWAGFKSCLRTSLLNNHCRKKNHYSNHGRFGENIQIKIKTELLSLVYEVHDQKQVFYSFLIDCLRNCNQEIYYSQDITYFTDFQTPLQQKPHFSPIFLFFQWYQSQIYCQQIVSQFNMELTIQDIESNSQRILQILGDSSFIEWQSFTRSTTDLSRQIEKLMAALALFKDIQQKRFLSTMKKLKGLDIPDLLKTVRAKKLPREALKSILGKFSPSSDGVVLNCSPQSLREESRKIYDDYVQSNTQIQGAVEQTNKILMETIKASGFYEEPKVLKELVSTFKHNFSKETIQQVSKKITVEPQPGHPSLINIKTYGGIVQHTFEVVQSEYVRLTKQSRAAQRKLIEDPKKYGQSLVEYLTNTEVLILEGQRAIVLALGLTQESVEQSEGLLMEKGLAQTVLILQSGLRTRVKESIETTSSVDFEKTKQVMRYQISMVKQRSSFFKNILGSLERTPQNFQIIPLIIALTLNDYVWQKYGIEQQDFMKPITDQVIYSNPDIGAIFKDMEKAILVLMRESGVISEDMAKVMEMQSEQIQKQMADMGLVGGQGNGIFPGSNPNDLLSFQQKSQMEQMKKK